MSQFSITRWARLSSVAALVVALAACGKGQQAQAPAATPAKTDAAATSVATVNGTPISRATYDIYLKSLLQQSGKQPSDLSPEQKGQVLDELISTDLLSAEAVKNGLDKDPDVVARLDLLRMRVLADAQSQKYLKGNDPTDAELHAQYDTAVAGLDKTEYKGRHILVATKEKAQELIKKIKGGAKFEDVAKAESTDSSKTNGGDLGWFTPSRMAKPFGDAVRSMKKGDMTQEPVQTQFGWHIIKIDDTREAVPPPFDQVKPQLTNQIMQKKLLDYIEGLKKSATVVKQPIT
jgi:peptidyl-prolyl cis-trans isomerase C